MRKPVFCICENKDADQLRGNREADHRVASRARECDNYAYFAILARNFELAA